MMTVCGHCGGVLGGSPSDDFCSEGCQWSWNFERACRLGPGLIGRPAELDRQIVEMIQRLDASFVVR